MASYINLDQAKKDLEYRKRIDPAMSSLAMALQRLGIPCYDLKDDETIMAAVVYLRSQK